MKLRRTKNQFSGMRNVRNGQKELSNKELLFQALSDAIIFSNQSNW